MAHAFAEFIRQQMDDRGLRNRDLAATSGLSRQLVSKHVRDERDQLTRLPEKGTIDGFAKALHVSSDFLLGKAIEALGLGYTSGDFVNSVATATDADLLAEIERRLSERGGELADRSAPNQTPDTDPADQSVEPVDLTTRRGGKGNKTSTSAVTSVSEVRSTFDDSEPRVAKKRPPRKRSD